MEVQPGATWCWALGLQAASQGPNQRGRRSRYGGVDLVMVMDSFGGGVVGGRIAGGGVLSLAQGLWWRRDLNQLLLDCIFYFVCSSMWEKE